MQGLGPQETCTYGKEPTNAGSGLVHARSDNSHIQGESRLQKQRVITQTCEERDSHMQAVGRG